MNRKYMVPVCPRLSAVFRLSCGVYRTIAQDEISQAVPKSNFPHFYGMTDSFCECERKHQNVEN